MALTPVDLHRRLSFIKYLYGLALAQSRRAPSLEAAVSILMFHDSVESFLNLALEHRGAKAGAAAPAFADYWKLLSQVGCGLTPLGPLERFNKVRVALKHHGIIPSPEEIESARVNVTAFFEDNTPRAFEPIAFAEVSLAELVALDMARTVLKRADRLIMEHQLEPALQQISLAWHRLFRTYAKTPPGFQRVPLSHLSMDMHRLARRGRREDPDDDYQVEINEVAETVNRVIDAVEDIERTLGILSLGIDLQRYQRFLDLTPRVSEDPPGGDQAVFHVNRQRANPPTNDELRYCYDFVIDVALHLQVRAEHARIEP